MNVEQFFFALVDASETTFGSSHHRVDLEPLTFKVQHDEGNLPSLTIEVKNPYVGLLAPGRKQWAWLAVDTGTTVIPLFFGRLIGLPTDILAEKVTLQFIAKPSDYVAQKAALATAMKVRPYYDKVFIASDKWDDPDTVLEGYSALWHVDRTTLAVTTSDIVTGEDGVEEFTEDDGFYTSTSLTIAQPPLASVTMDAAVTWTQQSSGSIDFGSRNIRSYTGGAIVSSWPKQGDQLQGGWSVASAEAIDHYGVADAQNVETSSEWRNREKTHANGDTMSITESSSAPSLRGPSLNYVLTFYQQLGFVWPPDLNQPAWTKSTGLVVPEWSLTLSLALNFAASRSRTERVRFTLNTNLQPVLTDPDVDQEAEQISLNGTDVGNPIDGTAPIGDSSRASYFATDRGLWSLEYLICVARAHALQRARAARCSRDIPFERAINLSCRKNALFYDHRLPGGQAVGKIVSYSFEGGLGTLKGNVVIGSTLGYGGALVTAAGASDYIADDYIEAGYFSNTTQVVAIGGPADISYTPPAPDIADDLPFPPTRDLVVVSEQVVGSIDEQKAAIDAVIYKTIKGGVLTYPTIATQTQTGQDASASVGSVLADHPVYYQLELKPITGIAAEYAIDVDLSTFEVPKQIDLEAASL